MPLTNRLRSILIWLASPTVGETANSCSGTPGNHPATSSAWGPATSIGNAARSLVTFRHDGDVDVGDARAARSIPSARFTAGATELMSR